MYCINCGAAVPLKEWDVARTCGSCSAILYRPHEEVVSITEEASSISPIFAGGEEIASTVGRHPSASRGPEPRISDEIGPYFHLRVFTGKWESVWVEAPNVTTARRILFDKSDIEPKPVSGERSWGRGQAFILNQSHSTENKGEFFELPPGLEYFIDRFGQRQNIRPTRNHGREGE